MPTDSRRKPDKKRRRKSGDEWHITHVALALAIVIAFFGWAFAAAHYANSVEGWTATGSDPPSELARRGTTRTGARAMFVVLMVKGFSGFIANSFAQLPDAPWVVMHVFRDMIWIPIIVLILEALVVLFVRYDRKLRREWIRP